VRREKVDAAASPLEAVIFDMDGVLIDSEPIHFEATRALLAEHGVDYVPDRDENFYGCTDREVFRALRARYGLAADEAELSASWVRRVVKLLDGPLVPMPGVPEVLHVLVRSGFRLALASASAPTIIAATLTGLGVSGVFECTVSGHEVGRGKPAPDIFLETARRLDLEPGGCLVVEDSQNGVLAAVAAGIRCVAVPCQSTAAQDFSAASGRLSDLTRLPGWIELDARGPNRPLAFPDGLRRT
jgi:HAD superfamily hydrolase (TIGR01509 family)